MSGITRRQFTASHATTIFAPSIIKGGIRAGSKAQRLPLAFSTLGCPAWPWKKILDQASQNGYAALELRGLLDDIDITKSPQFTGGKLRESLKDLAALDLKVSDLGASARLGEPD